MRPENEGLAGKGNAVGTVTREARFYQPSHLRQEPALLTAFAAALVGIAFIELEWGWRSASISASSSLIRARASSRYFSRERFVRTSSSPCECMVSYWYAYTVARGTHKVYSRTQERDWYHRREEVGVNLSVRVMRFGRRWWRRRHRVLVAVVNVGDE